MWDHRPSADELLDARLADGWLPTPTSTVDGELIFGHACTRFGGCPPSDDVTPAERAGRQRSVDR